MTFRPSSPSSYDPADGHLPIVGHLWQDGCGDHHHHQSKRKTMYIGIKHLPIVGHLRQAEGNGRGGDEGDVEKSQHGQQLPKCRLRRVFGIFYLYLLLVFGIWYLVLILVLILVLDIKKSQHGQHQPKFC